MKRPGKDKQSREKSRRPILWLLLGAAAVALAVVLAYGLLGRDEEPGLVRDAPTATAPQRVGPVEVSATQVDLGRVPLGRWVKPTFRVRNVSQAPVIIIIPPRSVETLEGC